MSDEASKWRKRFDRERAARKEAEKLLEDKSRELFDLNESLKIKVKDEIEKNNKKELLLSEQSKLASMGEMIGNIAHQWRQPLSAISSSASSAKLQLELDIISKNELTTILDNIVNSTGFLSTTIDDFRNFFKSNNEKHEFDVIELCKRVENVVASTYSHNLIDLNISSDKKEIIYKGLSGELSQVILNILNNAKDILIERQVDKKIVNIEVLVKEKELNIFIIDNGGGVPEDIINKIFEPYFTTKHQSQGTGIGLYMTREIIKNHFLGEIKVRNKNFVFNEKEYLGAEFKISLPIGEIDGQK